MSDKPTIVEALAAVMGDVQAIRKGDRNTDQNFNFRGIDAVLNAVGPALRAHGVVVVPQVEDLQTESYTTKKGTAMRNVTVKVRWVFHGPAGDSIEAVTFGEAADSGDKAVSKAQSVAYRVALLQALTVPTDEPDPDANSHERALSEPDPMLGLKKRVMAAGQACDLNTVDDLATEFAETTGGLVLSDATPSELEAFLFHLNQKRGIVPPSGEVERSKTNDQDSDPWAAPKEEVPA